VSTFVPEIAVLLTQGFGLGMGRRDLLIARACGATEDKVARRQRQQSADNASLIPAKIIQRTLHVRTRAAVLCIAPMMGDARPDFQLSVGTRHIAPHFGRRLVLADPLVDDLA
jgi:hypothetical protein